MTTHAKLSPSKRHRWGACPASVREEAKYPEDRSGAAAIDGTHSHTLLEACIRDMMSPFAYVGQTLKDGDGEFKVDADRAKRVEVAVSHIFERRIAIRNARVISEMEVDPYPIFQRHDLSGHVDVQIVGDDHLTIIDYKDGMARVPAVGNVQLLQYAFGAICAHQDKTFKTVTLTIIQPKLAEKGWPAIDSWEVTMDELMNTHRFNLAMEALATDSPDAPFNPGESQCKYCKHKGACSALINQMMDASGIKFENLEVAQQAVEKEPTTMSDQQIRELIEAAPLLRQMLESVEKEALRRMESGIKIEGLKLVRGRGSRSWMYEDEAKMVKSLTKIGIPKAALFKKEMVSPAQCEKLRWKSKGVEAQLSDTQRVSLASLIKKSDGKLTVTSESDERVAVEVGAERLFDAVETLPSWLK
jgi:hypothetical protein